MPKRKSYSSSAICDTIIVKPEAKVAQENDVKVETEGKESR